MFEDFINALQNFRQNKTRTFLSLLGVIIGVASVILITTLGQSATENVKKSFGSSGLDIIKVSSGFMNRRSSSGVQFTESFRDELWDNIENLKKIHYEGTQSMWDSISNSSSIPSNATLVLNSKY